MAGKRAGRSALLCALAALACGDPTGVELELERSRSRWEERGPASYTMTLQRACECTTESAGPVRIEVDAGTITARTYVATGGAVAPALEDGFPDVEGLFRLIEDAIEGGAASVQATYDPELGYPLQVVVDYDAQTADEERAYAVTELVVP